MSKSFKQQYEELEAAYFDFVLAFWRSLKIPKALAWITRMLNRLGC